MSAMMPFLPARMRVFPHSGSKKHDAIPDSASTTRCRICYSIAPGIDFSIQIDPRHFKNQTTIKKVKIKTRKKDKYNCLEFLQ